MNIKDNLAKLAEFEAILDSHLFETEEDNKSSYNRTKSALAIGAAGAGGLYAKDKLQKKYGQGNVMSGIKGDAEKIAKKKVINPATKAWARSAEETTGKRVLRAARAGAAGLMYHEADIAKRIVELDAKTDRLVELRNHRA